MDECAPQVLGWGWPAAMGVRTTPPVPGLVRSMALVVAAIPLELQWAH